MVRRRQERRHARDFGEAVGLGQLALEDFGGLLQHDFADRRTGIGHQLQVLEIGLPHAWVLQHELDHGGNQQGVGDALGREALQIGGRVEFRIGLGARARVERAHQHADAGHMKHRQGVAHHMAVVELPVGVDGLCHGQQAFMRQHHAFGQARGAGGIELQRRVVGMGLHGREVGAEAAVPGLEAGQIALCLFGAHQGLEPGQAGFLRVCRKCRIGQQKRRLPVVHDVFEFGHRQPPVHGHADGAELAGREQQQHAVEVVPGQRRHPVARPDAHRGQRVGNPIARAFDIAIAQAPVALREGHGIGAVLQLTLERIYQGLIVHNGLLGFSGRISERSAHSALVSSAPARAASCSFSCA
ncbi:hypothetical protein D3C78_1015680 [compost metagenome]